MRPLNSQPCSPKSQSTGAKGHEATWPWNVDIVMVSSHPSVLYLQYTWSSSIKPLNARFGWRSIHLIQVNSRRLWGVWTCWFQARSTERTRSIDWKRFLDACQAERMMTCLGNHGLLADILTTDGFSQRVWVETAIKDYRIHNHFKSSNQPRKMTHIGQRTDCQGVETNSNVCMTNKNVIAHINNERVY